MIGVDLEIRVGTGALATHDAPRQPAVFCNADTLGTNADDGTVLLEEVHRTFAQKTRHPKRSRVIEDALRLAGILDASVNEYGDAVADAHCFGVIVGYIENRAGETLPNADHGVANRTAQRRIDVRKRLVEQQRGRIGKQRSRDRGALTFAAGELTRPAIELRLNVERLRGGANPRVARIASTQREAKVLAHAHMGKERVVLSHEGDATGLRLTMRNRLAIEAHIATIRAQ